MKPLTVYGEDAGKLLTEVCITQYTIFGTLTLHYFEPFLLEFCHNPTTLVFVGHTHARTQRTQRTHQNDSHTPQVLSSCARLGCGDGLWLCRGGAADAAARIGCHRPERRRPSPLSGPNLDHRLFNHNHQTSRLLWCRPHLRFADGFRAERRGGRSCCPGGAARRR